VNKFAYGIRLPFSKSWLVQFSEPKRGDIVVFRSVDEDGKFMIKRVVGVPGDTIEYRDDGRLIVNGQETPHTLMPDPVQAAKAAPFYPVHSGDIGMDLNQVDFFKDQLGENTFRSLLIKDSFRWRIPSIKVGEGKFFMMGDKRDNSKDSRSWGEMPKENLLGKAMFVWLSCESTLPVVDFLCNPLSVRWGRFFQPIE
jgi:signal peptidase I